ncbi:MAG TPA: hypothetical protein VI248_05955, partial [Kineosporiaceae bacterium]
SVLPAVLAAYESADPMDLLTREHREAGEALLAASARHPHGEQAASHLADWAGRLARFGWAPLEPAGARPRQRRRSS